MGSLLGPWVERQHRKIGTLPCSKGRLGSGNKGDARPKDVSNKLTDTHEGVTEDELGCHGPEHLHRRALENPTDFYKIAARLIPAATVTWASGTPTARAAR